MLSLNSEQKDESDNEFELCVVDKRKSIDVPESKCVDNSENVKTKVPNRHDAIMNIKNVILFEFDQNIDESLASFIHDYCKKSQIPFAERICTEGIMFLNLVSAMYQQQLQIAQNNRQNQDETTSLKTRKQKSVNKTELGKDKNDNSESEWDISDHDNDNHDSEYSSNDSMSDLSSEFESADSNWMPLHGKNKEKKKTSKDKNRNNSNSNECLIASDNDQEYALDCSKREERRKRRKMQRHKRRRKYRNQFGEIQRAGRLLLNDAMQLISQNTNNNDKNNNQSINDNDKQRNKMTKSKTKNHGKVEKKSKNDSKMENEKSNDKQSAKSSKTSEALTKEIEEKLFAAGWSEARINAYKNKDDRPNEFYYRFNKPGEQAKTEPWSKQEHKLFMQTAMQKGVNNKWGSFSKDIPGRVGYVCSNYWRKLLECGDIEDPNYYFVDQYGNEYNSIRNRKNVKCTLKFRRFIVPKKLKNKTDKKSLAKLEKYDNFRMFGFKVFKDDSGVFGKQSELPKRHPKAPDNAFIKQIIGEDSGMISENENENDQENDKDKQKTTKSKPKNTKSNSNADINVDKKQTKKKNKTDKHKSKLAKQPIQTKGKSKSNAKSKKHKPTANNKPSKKTAKAASIKSKSVKKVVSKKGSKKVASKSTVAKKTESKKISNKKAKKGGRKRSAKNVIANEMSLRKSKRYCLREKKSKV